MDIAARVPAVPLRLTLKPVKVNIPIYFIVIYRNAGHTDGKERNMAIQVLNGENFDAHINAAQKPVIVDFYADWCGPCKMIAPVLEQLAREQEGEVLFYKINVDNDSPIASRFQVQSIPTLIAFKDGKIVNTMVGAGSKIKILDMVK